MRFVFPRLPRPQRRWNAYHAAALPDDCGPCPNYSS
jgi:hypothetical protein